MRALSLFPFAALFIATVQAQTTGSFGTNVVDYIPQSFFFNWDQGASPPNPTTGQCNNIDISWGRGAATGPNPVAPYKLLVLTSTQTVPYVIDVGSGLEYNWTVPFAPGTQYEICMFDSNGATGGCQAIYTMYPGNSTGCQSLSVPSQTLDVSGIVEDGPISQYGWINQCTDISLTPKNGTPPFTMLVSPALHPPYKITSNTMDAINWTVSLSWASPFFISLTDANGYSWSNGPLHSGGGPSTSTACLSLVPGAKPKKQGVSLGIVIGSSVGGLVLGVIVGMVVASFFARHQYNQVRRNSSTDSIDQTPFKRTDVPHSPGPTGPDMGPNQYLVEPFLPEGPNSPTRSSMPNAPTSAYSNAQSDGSGGGANPHVYVVHHDGGGAPVTVFTGGAGVTELPPSYVGRSESHPSSQPSASGSSNVEQLDRRARPGPTPRKSQAGLQ